MHVSRTINAHELPDRFRQVFEIVPQDAWERRAEILTHRECMNPFLSEYFDERYTIERFFARALDYRSRVGSFPPVTGPHGKQYFDLYSFVHILTSAYPRLSAVGQLRVRGYITDGLKGDDGLAAFAHELAVAVHLWSAGFDVDFADIEGQSRFDILARKDGLELEIDAKTASADIGRKIHRHRALELFSRLHPALEGLHEKGGGRTVDIVLPDALHGAEPYMSAVTSAVSDALLQDKSVSVAQVADVSLGEFDHRELVGELPIAKALRPIAARLGRASAHLACFGSPGHGAILAMISSSKPDKVVDGIYRALKASAERQFSGANPAMIAIRLLDLTMGQLHDLASSESNKLAPISNRLFAGERRKHLFGVVFLSPADVLSQSMDYSGSSFSDGGIALLFRHERHPLAQDPRLAIFERAQSRGLSTFP
jgi:hypothetical protein